MSTFSFVLIGSGVLLRSTINEITENQGCIKLIYVDNPTDTKRYESFHRVKQVTEVEQDFNDLKAIIDSSTWLLSVDNKKLLSAEILSLFKGKALNFHPGILPNYKGLYCYQWAVANGEKEFAATIHFMEPDVDAGDIVIERRFPIEDKDTGFSIYQKSLKNGQQAIESVLSKIFNQVDLPRVSQTSEMTNIWGRAKPYQIEIEWDKTPKHIINSLRASNFYPFKPPAFQVCFNGIPVIQGEKLKITTTEVPGTILNVQGQTVRVAVIGNSVIEIQLLPIES